MADEVKTDAIPASEPAKEQPKQEEKQFSLSEYRKLRAVRTPEEPETVVTEPEKLSVEGEEPTESEAESDSAENNQEQDDKEGDKKPKNKRGAIEDIKKQRNRAQAAERENSSLKKDNEALRLQLDEAKKKPTESKPESETPKGKPVAPKLANFQTIDDYEAARDTYTEQMSDWKLGQYRAEQDEENKKAKAAATKQEQTQNWQKQVSDAEKKFPDFRELVLENQDLPISQAMFDTIASSENGAEIAYYLGQNPEEAKRIAELNPRKAVFELGRIASKLDEPPTPEKPAPRASNAPQPITPVGRRSGPTVPNLETMTQRQYRELRKSGRL